MPETFIINCGCNPAPGTTPPDIAPYVVSLNNLSGLVTLAGTGATEITSSGNIITIGLSASAGLGSVTSVALASSNSNLVIASGSPILTNGTITLDLAGNLDSISGLVMAADQMLYSTAADTFAATSLTAFARTLLDDANNTAARSTLGLVIGTNVQAWSADLDSFVTNASWSGADLTLAGDLNVDVDLVVQGNGSTTGTFTSFGLISGAAGASFSGNVDAGSFTGDGSGLTNLQAGDISSGTLAVARGGTNISSYAIGDLIHATGATTLTKLASVSAGSYLRSAGVTTASVWSTLKLPNSATVGDILYCNSSNNISNLADIATGNVLLSGGVATAPAYGKVTSSHVDSTIPTISSGANSDITDLNANVVTFGGNETVFNTQADFNTTVADGTTSVGSSGYVFTSTGTGVLWTNQLSISTLTLSAYLNIPKTITAGGVTGAQTINKPSGSVNFAAAASSLVVTNNLVTANSVIIATVGSNDSTMKSVQAVATTGSFTLYPNANPTAETRVNFLLTN